MRVSRSTLHTRRANSFQVLTAIARRFQGQSLSQRQIEPRAPPQKTIVVLGPQGGGKATTVGNMIYKVLPKLDISTVPSVEFEECGGIDLATMEAFQRHGVQNYDQVLPALRARNVLPSFSTPKCEIVVLDEAGADASRADCALLVIAADAAVPSLPHGLEG